MRKIKDLKRKKRILEIAMRFSVAPMGRRSPRPIAAMQKAALLKLEFCVKEFRAQDLSASAAGFAPVSSFQELE
ncbi:hypothetical protein [Rhizobium sp. BK602]|uniref:hypothetical protein n=1 Tax=Rhizobium sp. BK602 TaxID=2586986 RepID=UPI0016131A5C|nr:hypothetical protein [Rhizobium sp. BK602]MBB3611227.1 hypothetical protein [Rhizobium sp. BK602]